MVDTNEPNYHEILDELKIFIGEMTKEDSLNSAMCTQVAPLIVKALAIYHRKVNDIDANTRL